MFKLPSLPRIYTTKQNTEKKEIKQQQPNNYCVKQSEIWNFSFCILLLFFFILFHEASCIDTHTHMHTEISGKRW